MGIYEGKLDDILAKNAFLKSAREQVGYFYFVKVLVTVCASQISFYFELFLIYSKI